MGSGTNGIPGAATVVPFTNRTSAPCGPRRPAFFHWRDFKDWVVSVLGSHTVELSAKADKVSGGTVGNLAGIGTGGSLVDSGVRPYTFDTVPTAGSLNPVTSGGIKQAIDAATPGDYDSVKARLAAAEGKIPTQASAQNQLADKAFVNSSVATATATFRGTMSGATEDEFLNWLAGITADANDYVFWNTTDAAGNSVFIRYKYTGAAWAYEYELNNSSFTAEQWAAISSGITSGLVAKLGALPTAEALAAALASKASTADATLTPIYSDTPTFSEWVFADVSDGITDIQQPVFIPSTGEPSWNVFFRYDGLNRPAAVFSDDENATNLTFVYDDEGLSLHFTATRTRTDIIGYTLGSQSDKPLQPKGDYAPATGIAKSALAQNVQASLDKADTALQTTGGTMTGALTMNKSVIELKDAVGYKRVLRCIGTGGDFYIDCYDDRGMLLSSISLRSIDGDVAFLSEVYAIVSQIAPAWVGGSSYAANECVSRNGVVYQNTSGSTISSSIPPGSIGSGWAAKKVSELFAPLASPAFTGTPTAPTPASGDNSSKVATTAFVQNAVGGITPGPDNTKLDATSAAPAFSTTSTYAVDEHCTYNGKLYRCTTAVTTAGEWNAANWTADTITDPDAVLDITSQNQLRVVAKDGTVLWAQGYDLASTSSATLSCDKGNLFTFADGATSQAFSLPTAPTGKVGDFILDIDNSANTGAATISFTDITNNTASVVIPKGENLNNMFSFAAGEMAELYFTKTTFTVNNLPTWKVVKQVVENGGATV